MFPEPEGGDAVGVIIKIDDGTADYGLDGTFTYQNSKDSIVGKFRLAKDNKYNSAHYENKTITIKDCSYSYGSVEDDWTMILYDFIIDNS